MKTRIRHFRKMKGMTLRQLAQLVGTTPQTIQRLETSNMTVSTDWLEKIAEALEVRISDLLDDGLIRGIPRLGASVRDGRVAPGPQSDLFTLDIPADDPVAVEITNTIGPYIAGSFVVGKRYSEGNLINAVGRNSIVGLKDGALLLRRVIQLPTSGEFSLLTFDSGGDFTHGAEIDWAAPIIMSVVYW